MAELILPSSVHPLETALGKPLRVPDIMEFVFSDRYLNRPVLFPRQGTLLKCIFLQDELLTQYDYDVIGEWSNGFHLPEHAGTNGNMRYQGTWGVQPDLLERIKFLKAQGRNWFREVIMVLGRRGSKGFLGGIAGAYVLWHYLAKGDPQGHYGIDRDKRIAAVVFSTKFAKARDEQWQDLVNVILGAPTFSDFLSNPQKEKLTIYAPHDLVRIKERESRGIKVDLDMASLEVLPRESTQMSGRGPTAAVIYFDEMSFIDKSSGASASADQVYESASPSLDQFGQDAFLWEGSSPWEQTGQFYTNWEHALEVEVDTHLPVYPEMFMAQLTSWDPYKDWEKAHTIKIVPGKKRTFPQKDRGVQMYDENMQRLERANPETFAVERRSHWSSSANAYLNPRRIEDMFGLYNGSPLEQQTEGKWNIAYVGHGDPSKVNDNFGFALGHTEGPDENGMMHVVFDKIHFWRPGDFIDNDRQIDYLEISEYFKHEVIDPFIPQLITFDQFGSVEMIQRLRSYVRTKGFAKGVEIHERTSTKPVNWKMAEAFKAALNMGLLHAPWHEQAELELKFLQDMGNQRVDHQTTGSVQSKDVADAMFNVVYSTIGNQMAAFLGEEFAAFPLTGAMQGGQRPFQAMDGEDNGVFSGFSQFNKARGARTSNSSPVRSLDRSRSSSWSSTSPFGNRTR
jgi:hypothetical protein